MNEFNNPQSYYARAKVCNDLNGQSFIEKRLINFIIHIDDRLMIEF